MMDERWITLLNEVRAAHDRLPDLKAFVEVPETLTTQDVTPYHIAAADLMCNDPNLFSDGFEGFRDALVAAGPLAQWREPYKDTSIGQEFMEKFACYEFIGQDAPYGTDRMRGFVVYQPPGLHYPWHHHPAEEMYVVLAGEAEFAIEGEGSKTLRAGATVYHRSNVPHALTTHDHPVLAYVLWRNHFNVKPVLTYPEDL